MTALPNPFIIEACDRSSPSAVSPSSAGTLEQGRPATVSGDVGSSSLPSGESEPSVMLAFTSPESTLRLRSGCCRSGDQSNAISAPTAGGWVRGFDPEAFMKVVADEVWRDAPPAFIAAPRPEYLKACEMMPMLAVLAGH